MSRKSKSDFKAELAELSRLQLVLIPELEKLADEKLQLQYKVASLQVEIDVLSDDRATLLRLLRENA